MFPAVTVSAEVVESPPPDPIAAAMRCNAAAHHEHEIAEFVTATGCSESVARYLLAPVAGDLFR